jgi:transposase/CheY-like chemotaxis protein
MSFIEGSGRDQQLMFPPVIDDYVTTDNPVRFIDAFVEGLRLDDLGFERSSPAETGRPAYNPKDLLRLYVYGYLNGHRSSRKLERETKRNMELMWLMQMLQPDFKTIADFRRDNGEAIRQVCRAFSMLCRQMDLFGRELVAIDGSKFRAVNIKDRNFTRKQLEKQIKEIDRKIDEYLGDLDEADEQEAGTHTPTAEELRKKIEELKKNGVKFAELLDQLDRTGETQVSLTDADSRSMKMRMGTDVCYNVQTAVDAKHKLIVANDVTNEGVDATQLVPMARQAQAILGADQLTVIADQGYASTDGVRECLEEGITPYVPKPVTSANGPLGLFTKDDFRYDAENDCYVCPADQRLTFRFETKEKGRPVRYYETSACGTCPLKPECTRNKRNRRISRHADEHVLEQMRERIAASPGLMRQRKAIVEHPFGTIKRTMGQGYFLTRGLANVRTEFSLSVLAYNMKRVFNIVGVVPMIATLA